MWYSKLKQGSRWWVPSTTTTGQGAAHIWATSCCAPTYRLRPLLVLSIFRPNLGYFQNAYFDFHTNYSHKKYTVHMNSSIQAHIRSYRSLQMQMIGLSRMDSFFFFFFAVSAASPPCPSFLFRVANSTLIAACWTQQTKGRKQYLLTKDIKSLLGLQRGWF